MANYPTIENYRALMIQAIETDDFIVYLAAQVCAYNLRIAENLDDENE